MSNHYTAKVAESLKLRGWIDEIQAKSIRNELDRHKSCLEVARGEMIRLRDVVGEIDHPFIDSTLHQINEVLGGDSTKTT